MPIVTRTKNPSNPKVHDKTVDPLVAKYGRDLGPRTSELLDTWRQGLGLFAISRHNLTERIFNFCDGTALGLRMEERLYTQDDPYVSASPIRKAVCALMQAKSGGQRVAYVESASLVELGGGFFMSQRLWTDPFFAVGWSVSATASALVRVRKSFPVCLDERETADVHARYKHLDFPFTARAASELVPGAEIEMTGQGRVSGSVGLGMVGGLVAAPASAGLGLIAGVGALEKHEINLNILALNKPGHVRVTIRKLAEHDATFFARIRAGLIFSSGALTGPLIAGMLRFYTEKLGVPSFEEFLNLFTTLNTTLSGGVSKQTTTIGSWDIDLNQPQGRDAYESLVLLNTGLAREAVLNKSPAINELSVRENEVEMRIAADIGLLGQRLLGVERLNTHREGRLESRSAKSFKYRESIFTHRRRNIIRGIREVSWEAVSVKLHDQKKTEPHLHVHVEDRDWDFSTHKIAKLVRFAQCLGVGLKEMVGSDKETLRAASKHLEKSEEVTLRCEVYFTKKGISAIDKSDFHMAKNAFLQATTMISRRLNGVNFTARDPSMEKAVSIIDEYIALHKDLSNVWQAIHHSYLYDDYRELTGRDLKMDSDIVKEANQFATLVTKSKKRESADETASFFRQLSEKHKLDYMQTVAALAILAGAQETLVHELSVSDKDVTISNIPESAIESPRETIAHELYRTID